MDLANDIPRAAIDNVDVIGRTVFPCRNIEDLSFWMDRQAVDPRIELAIPQDRVVAKTETIDHSDAVTILVGDVELTGDGAGRDSSDVVDTWNRLDGFYQVMPGIDVVDRDRAAIVSGLVDRIQGS